MTLTLPPFAIILWGLGFIAWCAILWTIQIKQANNGVRWIPARLVALAFFGVAWPFFVGLFLCVGTFIYLFQSVKRKNTGL
jgi:hypothetical protein